jgi:hypothetical protein
LIKLYACSKKLTQKCKEVGGTKTKSRPDLIRAQGHKAGEKLLLEGG